MQEDLSEDLTAVRWLVFRRTVRLRCPQCGERSLFKGYARLYERCSRCDLVFRREQGAQTGSMYLTAAVTQGVAALVLAAGYLWTDWSVGTFLAVSLPLLLAFCAWFLPRAQALWCGIEYVTDVINREEWARPRR